MDEERDHGSEVSFVFMEQEGFATRGAFLRNHLAASPFHCTLLTMLAESHFMLC